MTDNAERKVREWANNRNGDPLTPKDVVDLVLAVDADSDDRHTETLQRLDDVDERHISLCLRVSELETVSIGCSERVKAFVAAEHDVRHTEHMASFHGPERRASDPPDAEFTDRRTLAADTEDAGELMQPGAVAGAVYEFHASRARMGTRPGANDPLTTEAFDTSGSGNHGTLTTFAGTTTSGWDGSGTLADPHRLVFDGTSDYVALPDLGACEDKVFTYEAWAATTSAAQVWAVMEDNGGRGSSGRPRIQWRQGAHRLL